MSDKLKPPGGEGRISGTLSVRKNESGEATARSGKRPVRGGAVQRGRPSVKGVKPAAPSPFEKPANQVLKRGGQKLERMGERGGERRSASPEMRSGSRSNTRPECPDVPDSARVKATPVGNDGQTDIRISKLMADRGLCSRREADSYIERGWVFVDGQRVTELGTRASPNAAITLAPEARGQQQARVTILLNKPIGYVSGQPEPGYQPAVVLVGRDSQWNGGRAAGIAQFSSQHLKGLAPAGRLDIDSTGLLVLTQNGSIARQLIGDDSDVEKEYLVRVSGQLVANGLALLNHGLELDSRKLRPAYVEWLNDNQLRFILREGRKRQIRRMCELVGLKVVALKRVRIGRICLGDLPVGQWRYLREDESF